MCFNVSPAACFLLLQEFGLFEQIFTLGIIIISTKKVMFSLLFACWFDCEQEYTKTSANTSMKLDVLWIREELIF